MYLMNIDRLACLQMYRLWENKQRKKDVANGSSLMFKNVSVIQFLHYKGFEIAWKDELLVVVGYNLEVFTIFWRAC